MSFEGKSRSKLLLATLTVALTAYLAVPAASPTAAADVLQLNPAADAWTSNARPNANYGTATVLRARKGASESFVYFNLSAWQGLRVSTLELRLAGIAGNASGLRLHRTTTGWKEKAITHNSRPSTLETLSSRAQSATATARFDLRSLFPTGVIDRTLLSLRLTNTQDALVTFGSRESSTKPSLMLTAGPRLDVVRLPSVADTWANSSKPSVNYKSASWLKVDGQPRREAFVKFDLSAWRGHAYQGMHLELQLGDGGGAGVTVYRVGTGWKEGALTWNKRPTGGTQLATAGKALGVGKTVIDITSAFGGQNVNSALLGLRI
ncbi:MAG: DNRLRE domain-containing protein, partial [Chloroflexota bacterium]|nr:DNRLRE domain-containing protein [Chloroflexota bacterium]